MTDKAKIYAIKFGMDLAHTEFDTTRGVYVDTTDPFLSLEATKTEPIQSTNWRARQIQEMKENGTWNSALDRYSKAQAESACARRKNRIRDLEKENREFHIESIIRRLGEKHNAEISVFKRARHWTRAKKLAKILADEKTQAEKRRAFNRELNMRSGVYCVKNQSSEFRIMESIKSDSRLYDKVYKRYRLAIDKNDYERESFECIRLANLTSRIENSLKKLDALPRGGILQSREYHSYLLLAGLYRGLANKDKIHASFYDACRHVRFAQYHIRRANLPL